MADNIDLATQRLIERLRLQDLEEVALQSERDTAARLRNDDFDLEEEEEFEAAIRLSRQEYERDVLGFVGGAHGARQGGSSRVGAADDHALEHNPEAIGRNYKPARERRAHEHSRGHAPAGRAPRPGHDSLPAQPGTPTEEPAEGECVICADSFPTRELFRPRACPETEPRHYYCVDCMKVAFKGALRDEARFPVRCCPASGPFDIRQVQTHFEPEFTRQYHHREAELNTRNRIYCSRPTCSTFIEPEQIDGDKATCGACGHHTCSRCKQPYHPGAQCPEQDEEVTNTINLGKEEAWQRCPECGEMVDLHSGCNQLTCRCGTDFCFECGKKWKTCGCPIMGDHRLEPAELDRRGAQEAERIHEDELAQWDIDRQLGFDQQFDIDMGLGAGHLHHGHHHHEHQQRGPRNHGHPHHEHNHHEPQAHGRQIFNQRQAPNSQNPVLQDPEEIDLQALERRVRRQRQGHIDRELNADIERYMERRLQNPDDPVRKQREAAMGLRRLFGEELTRDLEVRQEGRRALPPNERLAQIRATRRERFPDPSAEDIRLADRVERVVTLNRLWQLTGSTSEPTPRQLRAQRGLGQHTT